MMARLEAEELERWRTVTDATQAVMQPANVGTHIGCLKFQIDEGPQMPVNPS